MQDGGIAFTDVNEIRQRRIPSISARNALFDPAGIVGVIVAVFIWQLASSAMGDRVPTPQEVIANAFDNLSSSDHFPGIGLPRGGYMPHLLFTAYNVLLGGGIGALVGIFAGLASAENRIVADVADPIVSILGTIPIVILAPFFLMWFGLSGVPQIALVAIYTATVLYLFAHRGAKNLPSAFTDYAATLGVSATQRFLRVRLPGALPEIFGGLRIAFSAAWGLSAVTEMLGGRLGAGRVLVALRSVYDLTGIMAVVLLLGAFAILLDCLILTVRLYVLRWASFLPAAERSA
jgi:ABC-type nitrate/sulfonate/bicarbonate transport system permease component